jgi:hypothetical protein
LGNQLDDGFHENPMSDRTCCPVVELRQYKLVPGQRETLIALFEREFIKTQEATGMTVIGQFRDLNNPNRFVWLRGFGDMASRARQLEEFYGGPIWKEHREAANATMIDSDNVLLLQRARTNSGFRLENLKRPPSRSERERKQFDCRHDFPPRRLARFIHRTPRNRNCASADETRRFDPRNVRH